MFWTIRYSYAIADVISIFRNFDKEGFKMNQKILTGIFAGLLLSTSSVLAADHERPQNSNVSDHTIQEEILQTEQKTPAQEAREEATAARNYADEMKGHRQVVEFVCPKDVDIFTLDILRA